ncbi:hypothetical protein WUBG_16643, partial [Wuchereria bancrofti]
MNKLLGWLRNWAKNHLGAGARPPPWLAQSDGTAFKAVMLSGPPGNTSSEITHVLIMDEVDGMSGNDDRAG